MSSNSDLYSDSSSDESINQNICYLCMQSDGILITPCTQCSVLAHEKCINEQLKHNNLECGQCKSKLSTTSVKKLNYKSCCHNITSIILVLLSWLSLITLPLLILGSTVTNWEPVGLYVMLLLIPVCPYLFIQTLPNTKNYLAFRNQDGKFNIHFVNEQNNEFSETRYQKHLLGTIVISHLLVFMAHVIGYPILIWLFDIKEFFTWKSGFAGVIIFYLLVLVGALLYMLFLLVKHIIKSNMKETIVINV